MCFWRRCKTSMRPTVIGVGRSDWDARGTYTVSSVRWVKRFLRKTTTTHRGSTKFGNPSNLWARTATTITIPTRVRTSYTKPVPIRETVRTRPQNRFTHRRSVITVTTKTVNAVSHRGDNKLTLRRRGSLPCCTSIGTSTAATVCSNTRRSVTTTSEARTYSGTLTYRGAEPGAAF